MVFICLIVSSNEFSFKITFSAFLKNKGFRNTHMCLQKLNGITYFPRLLTKNYFLFKSATLGNMFAVAPSKMSCYPQYIGTHPNEDHCHDEP